MEVHWSKNIEQVYYYQLEIGKTKKHIKKNKTKKKKT